MTTDTETHLSGLTDFSSVKRGDTSPKEKQSIDTSPIDLTHDNFVNTVLKQQRIIKAPPERFYSGKQVRTQFEEQPLEELAETMKSQGQQQPIVVHPSNEDGLYLISKGERRWRASKLIPGFQLEAIIDQQALVRTPMEELLTQIIENDQREPLSAWEYAQAIDLMINYGVGSKSDIARSLGWLEPSGGPSHTKVRRLHSITKIPEKFQLLVKENKLTDIIIIDKIRSLLETSPHLSDELYQHYLSKGLSRKLLEDMVRSTKNNVEMDNPLKTYTSAQDAEQDRDHDPLQDNDDSSQTNGIETGTPSPSQKLQPSVTETVPLNKTQLSLVLFKTSSSTSFQGPPVEGRIVIGDKPDNKLMCYLETSSGRITVPLSTLSISDY